MSAESTDTPSTHDASLGRRALIAGAAVLGAAGVASIASAPSAQAGNGDALRLGRFNRCTSRTEVEGTRDRWVNEGGPTNSINTNFLVSLRSTAPPRVAETLYGLRSVTVVEGLSPRGGEVISLAGWVNGRGTGVQGTSDTGTGVSGKADSGTGVAASGGSRGVVADASNAAGIGVAGTANGTGGTGVKGVGEGVGVDGRGGIGVLGTSAASVGVKGVSTSGTGVEGTSTASVGVKGVSTSGTGVEGTTTSGAQAVLGNHPATTGNATGVKGTSASATGVGVTGVASHASGVTQGVRGDGTASPLGTGVTGLGQANGVYGESRKVGGRGVFGFATQADGTASHGVYGQTASATGAGVYGKSPAYDPDLAWNVTSYGVFADGALASTGPAFLGAPEYGADALADARFGEGQMTFATDFSTPSPKLIIYVKNTDGVTYKAELPLTRV